MSVYNRQANSPSLAALVIDQPASRQKQIANRVYPSLAQFSVFSGHGIGTDGFEPLSELNLRLVTAAFRSVVETDEVLVGGRVCVTNLPNRMLSNSGLDRLMRRLKSLMLVKNAARPM